MEKRRGRRDRGDQEEKRGNQRGESILASNQFLMCSPQSGPIRDVHRVTQRRRGRTEIEVTRTRSGEVKRRETDLARNQFLKCSPQPRAPKEIHRFG